MKISKAIITAAGRGTRFFPVAKAFQKEMVPVMNKPQLQWVIEEAVDSGISEIAIVCREGVDTFQKYLQDDNKLWRFLKKQNKEHLLDSLLSLKNKAKITIFKQKDSDPYGNGIPVLIAKNFIGKDEPFATLWGDDIMIHVDKGKPTCLRQMMQYYEKYRPAAVMSAQKVSREEISKYGSYDYFDKDEFSIPFQVKNIIEKPEPENAPSLMANACRFILTPVIFNELDLSSKANCNWYNPLHYEKEQRINNS